GEGRSGGVMVEQIMFIGIGFLIAGLLVIGVIPLVHARAVRLTMRRLEALTPMSIAEIQADKDQLRAEFAMTMSRLEMNVEQMKAKTTNQLADLARKSEAIGRLKLELGEKTAALFALEAKEKQLSDDLQTTQTELAAKTGALEETERALASARTELTQVTANFNDASVAPRAAPRSRWGRRARRPKHKGPKSTDPKKSPRRCGTPSTQSPPSSRRRTSSLPRSAAARTIWPAAPASSTASSPRKRRSR